MALVAAAGPSRCSAPARPAAQTVSMGGSLGNKALLVIDGKPRNVAVGATVDGVRLVSVSGNDAVVEVKGKRVALQLGGAPGQSRRHGRATAAAADRPHAESGGHFFTTGTINGKTRPLPRRHRRHQRRRWARPMPSGSASTTRTASAANRAPPTAWSPSTASTLASVRDRRRQVYNVDATVLPAPMPLRAARQQLPRPLPDAARERQADPRAALGARRRAACRRGDRAKSNDRAKKRSCARARPETSMDLELHPRRASLPREDPRLGAREPAEGDQRQGQQLDPPDAATTCSAGPRSSASRAGSAGAGRRSSAARAGTRSRSTCSRKRRALAGAPRVIPFGPVMVAPVIMAFGTPEQQQRFLPGIASGEVWWSQGYSEPGSGSDLASLKTKAERRGDYYIVNGQKTWTTLGQYGDWIFCLVRTIERRQAADRHQLPADRHEEPGHHGAADHHDGRRARGQRGLVRQRRGARPTS